MTSHAHEFPVDAASLREARIPELHWPAPFATAAAVVAEWWANAESHVTCGEGLVLQAETILDLARHQRDLSLLAKRVLARFHSLPWAAGQPSVLFVFASEITGYPPDQDLVSDARDAAVLFLADVGLSNSTPYDLVSLVLQRYGARKPTIISAFVKEDCTWVADLARATTR